MSNKEKKPPDSRPKADLPGGCDVTSTHKTSATKTVQIPTNTAYVALHSPFWRDQKFWIQIAIMGIMQLAICAYMNPAINKREDIFSEKTFKDLLDEDWKKREIKLAEDLDSKINVMRGELTSVKKEWEKREQTLENYFNGILEENVTQLTENIRNVKSEIEGKLISMNGDWEKRELTLKGDFNRIIEEKVKQLTENIRNVKSEMEGKLVLMKGEWEKRELTLKDDFNGIIEEKVTQLTENIRNVASEMEGKLVLMKGEWEKREQKLKMDIIGIIDEKVTQLTENIRNVKSEMEGKLISMNGEWEKREQKLKMDIIGIIDEKLTELTKKHIKTLERTQALESKMKDMTQDMENMEKKSKSIDKRIEGVDGQLNFFFEEIYDINNYMVFFLLVAMVVFTIITYKFFITKPKLNNKTAAAGPVHGVSAQRTASEASIMDELKTKEIKDGILIISFESSTQDFHHTVLMTVSVFNSMAVEDAIIRNYNDLKNVEPHNIVFIFVDFNGRNIILENDESEIGDCRNQTTKVFLSLGCNVFVIYCRDKGSQTLPPNKLYNTALTSVENHPVLAELNKKKKVFSINDRFHPNQVELLKKSFEKL